MVVTSAEEELTGTRGNGGRNNEKVKVLGLENGLPGEWALSLKKMF